MKRTLNYILNILMLVLVAVPAFSQTAPGRRVDGTVFTGLLNANVNFVRAPQPYVAGDFNSANVATTSSPAATMGRDTTNLFNGQPTWTCVTGGGVGAYCEWKLNPILAPADNGLCVALIYAKGSAASVNLHSLQISDGTTAIASNSLVIGNQAFTIYQVTGSCGATRTVRLAQTAAGTSPTISLAVGYGAMNAQSGWLSEGWKVTTLDIQAVSGGTAPSKGGTKQADYLWYKQNGPNMDFRIEYKQTSAGTAGVGAYRFMVSPAITGCTIDTAKVTAFTGNATTATNVVGTAQVSDGTAAGTGTVGVYDSSSVQLLTTATSVAQYNPVSQTWWALSGNPTSYNASFSVPCVGFSPYTNIVPASQANYGPRPYTPTFTGFGTVSNVDCTEARQGSYNIIDCRFTAGTTTAVEARVSLPGTNVTTTWSPALPKIAGWAGFNRSSTTLFQLAPLIEPGLGYITFGLQDSTNGVITKRNGDAIVSSTQNIHFRAYVQIAGWYENGGASIGPGSVTTNNPTQGERIVRATVSGTVCTTNPCTLSGSSKDVTVAYSGTTGLYNIVFTSPWPDTSYTCTGTSGVPGVANGLLSFSVNSRNTNNFGFYCTTPTTNATQNCAFDFICMGPK